MSSGKQIAFIIPVKNEGNTIGPLIRALVKTIPDAFLCVIINNSTDNTYDNCLNAFYETGINQRSYLLKVIDKPGKANAVKVGLQLVSANYYVLMDADGQHEPADAAQLIKNMKQLKLEMIIGSRFLVQNAQKKPFDLRVFFNKRMNRLTNFLFKVQLTDVLSGYRVMTHEFVRTLDIYSVNFELEMELLIHAVKHHYKIDEYPINISQRTDKKESKLMLLKDGLNILIFTLFKRFS